MPRGDGCLADLGRRCHLSRLPDSIQLFIRWKRAGLRLLAQEQRRLRNHRRPSRHRSDLEVRGAMIMNQFKALTLVASLLTAGLISCVDHRPVRNGLRDESIYLKNGHLDPSR